MKYMWNILHEILTDLICAGPEHVMIWRQSCLYDDQSVGPASLTNSLLRAKYVAHIHPDTRPSSAYQERYRNVSVKEVVGSVRLQVGQERV